MFDELKAMKKIMDILADANNAERDRVLDWVAAKVRESKAAPSFTDVDATGGTYLGM